MTEQKSLGVYPPSFNHYISLVENEELSFILEKQRKDASEFFNSIPEGKWLYKYAENKWTIKEVLQHITDTEIVFAHWYLQERIQTHFLLLTKMNMQKIPTLTIGIRRI